MPWHRLIRGLTPNLPEDVEDGKHEPKSETGNFPRFQSVLRFPASYRGPDEDDNPIMVNHPYLHDTQEDCKPVPHYGSLEPEPPHTKVRWFTSTVDYDGDHSLLGAFHTRMPLHRHAGVVRPMCG